MNIVIFIIIILIVIILYKSTEKFEAIPYESVTQKKISEMLIPNCNMLTGDYGNTCKNTKGCTYDELSNSCYYNWIDII
jgi:hypothetical protein